MTYQNPIYSEATRCQDCYRCIRECPVKAIRVVNEEAEVVSEACILCGHCVAACPAGAKRVRDDLRRAAFVLERKQRVILSLAPSYVSEFGDVERGKLIHAVRSLGFYGVSETALGAQEVTRALERDFAQPHSPLILSSACTAAVSLVTHYLPHLTESIARVHSPLLAHCRMLREVYGNDIGIVFAGPCIAKKQEADENPQLLDVVITFEDLRSWFDQKSIDPGKQPVTAEDRFVPETARNGALYPVVGGMNATFQPQTHTEVTFMTLSGVPNIKRSLETLTLQGYRGKPLFIELLACENGCIHGPRTTRQTPIAARLAVLEAADTAAPDPTPSPLDIRCTWQSRINPGPDSGPEEIQEALASIGKTQVEHELNCGSCGYATCREFARALLSGKAEACMCVSHMRELAQKKANALIKTIPFGVVMVDAQLKIIDSNEQFVALFPDELSAIHQIRPGLKNADLRKILPFHHLFDRVLTTGREMTHTLIRYNSRILAVTIFIVEKNQVVGALLHDATMGELRREQIIDKAQEVMKNTAVTAQEIALHMGRNAAQCEKILTSLIDSFSLNKTDIDCGSP